MRYVIAPGAEKWIGFARNRAMILEQLRVQIGVPMLTRLFYLPDGSTALIQVHQPSMRAQNLIKINAGGSGQIAILQSGQLWSYDYLSDTLLSLTSVSELSYELDTMFNGVLHGGSSLLTATGGEQADVKREYISSDVASNISLFLNENNVVEGWQANQGFKEMALLPGTNWLPELATAQSTTLMPRLVQTTWNYNNGLDLWVIGSGSGNVFSSGYWRPNLSFAFPANGAYFVGWYYGKLFDWTSTELPLIGGKIKFGCFLDVKDRSATHLFGHLEVVTQAVTEDGTDNQFSVYGFLSTVSPYEPGNPTQIYSRFSGVTAGTDISGKNPDIRILLPDFDPLQDFKASLWTCPSKVKDEFSINVATYSGYGIVISQGSKATVVRFNGYNKTLLETDEYIDHAVSPDGKLLAVFEGVDDIIATTTVFDMEDFGTILRDKGTSSVEHPLDTAFFPALYKTAEDNVPGWMAEDLKSIADEDTFLFRAPDAVLNMPDLNKVPAATKLYKITCTDGVTANIHVVDDPCMDNSVTVMSPDSDDDVTVTVEGQKFSGPFDEVVSQLPYVLATISGKLQRAYLVNFKTDGLQTTGVSVSGTGVGTTEISRPDSFLMGFDLFNDLAYGRFVGDFIPGQCVQADGSKDPSCRAECGGDITYSASTSCGQTAEVTVTTPDPDPLYITGDTAAVELGAYGGGGGVAPYKFEISSGTIDEVTGIIPAGGLAGTCGTGSVTVTDSCGTTATMAVGFPSGKWGPATITEFWSDSSTFEPWPGCGGGATCTISTTGTTRTKKYWKTSYGCMSDYCASYTGWPLDRAKYDNVCAQTGSLFWWCQWKTTEEQWVC